MGKYTHILVTKGEGFCVKKKELEKEEENERYIQNERGKHTVMKKRGPGSR